MTKNVARGAVVFLALAAGCGGSSAPADRMVGLYGAPLASSLAVHVFDEVTGAPLSGVHVSAGSAHGVTDASGDAQLPITSAVVDLLVEADGHVTERWLGVDRERAIVSVATPVSPRTLDVTVQHGAGDASVGVASVLTVLRASAPFGSAAACRTGTCATTLSFESRASTIEAVVVDGTHAVLAGGLDAASGSVTIDLSAAHDTDGVLTVSGVTLPSGPELTGVVGVPGIGVASAALGEVALVPSPTGAPIATLLPVGAAASLGRRWYVARGTTMDGTGESMAFDRDVSASGAVALPSSFLTVPSATFASGMVSFPLDLAVDLYVVEATDGTTSERTIVFRQADATQQVPIGIAAPTHVRVRAIDVPAGTEIRDLDAVEHDATRVATRSVM
jgi:hypothetical protein